MLINIKEAYSDRIILKTLVLANRIKPTKPIKHIDVNLLKEIKTALKGCLAYDGIGIAANQLGIDKSFFLIREDEENFRVYCNPKVIKLDKAITSKEKEGCLSVPRYQLLVERSNQITVSWETIENGTFTAIEKTLEGNEARVFLHEYDHLQGLSIIDRTCELNRTEKRKLLKELSQ